MILALIMGLTLGIVAAVRKNGLADHFCRLIAVTGVGIAELLAGAGADIPVLLFDSYHRRPGRKNRSFGSARSSNPADNRPLHLDSLVTGNWEAFKSSVAT